ncbi:MAG: hypothetical protein ACLQU1_04490 [Bryobacteraceae bacterium]
MIVFVALARRPWFWLLIFLPLLLWSRWPLMPGQLFTFDDVNLAWSLNRFDIRISQPHPPGYPLFVLQMRVLWWLRFRHVEHLLFALALAGSLAALLLVAWWGNRTLGGDSGFFAGCLLVLHPVFWHAGVTSALRVQLAVISVGVAAACWQAWQGDARWVLRSAILLALGAGIRPETGPLLFPLWAASAWRAPVTSKERRIALAAMAGTVLLWLLPAMFASGGPIDYVKACLNYISDQASVSSGIFGATESRWQTTFWQLILWIFCGVPALALPVVLAWRRRGGFGLGWLPATFLALWFLPAFGFAVLVHVEDPGQTLAMAPVVALAGGYLIHRAIENTTTSISRWHTAIAIAAALALAWVFDRHFNAPNLVTWVPVVFLTTGILLKFAQAKYTGFPPRAQIVLVLLFPVAIQDLSLFNRRGWYYRGESTTGLRATAEHILADFESGLALTSREHIETTLALDDHVLQQVRCLAAERPGEAVVVWEHGLTAWRKAAYYLPGLPIVVLDRKKIRSGSPPVIDIWKGARLKSHLQGAAPLRVALPEATLGGALHQAAPGGALHKVTRIVWMLNPATDFFALVQENFAPVAAGPVWYSDLTGESALRRLGEYELTW